MGGRGLVNRRAVSAFSAAGLGWRNGYHEWRSSIMLIGYKRGQGSIVLRVKILNSSVSTGAGLTGLTFSSTGLIISTIADNESSATAYTVAGSTIETIATLGTYSAPTA